MVLVSHRHEFVYLKTHRTGSTTAELFLEPWCVPEGVAGHVPDRNLNREIITRAGIVGIRKSADPARRKDLFDTYWFNHMGAQRVRRQLGRKRFFGYTKVACVRNPFRRLLSAYFHLAVWRPRGYEWDGDLDAHRAQFRRFLEAGDDPSAGHAGAKNDRYVTHLTNGTYVVDHVLRTEHLEADMAALLDRLGIARDTPLALPRERRNPHWPEGWDVMQFFGDAPDLVEHVYRLDDWMFDAGGYSRDPADA